MSVKEYIKSGFCEIHKSQELEFTGSENPGDTWWECPICRKEDWKNFYKFVEETSKEMDLLPEWRGGKGLGVTCPRCNGKGVILPELQKEIKLLIKRIKI